MTQLHRRQPHQLCASCQVAPSLAINYCAYETLRSHWLSYTPERRSPTVTMSLLCGSFAGLISSTATFPLDLARRRMQVCCWWNNLVCCVKISFQHKCRTDVL